MAISQILEEIRQEIASSVHAWDTRDRTVDTSELSKITQESFECRMVEKAVGAVNYVLRAFFPFRRNIVGLSMRDSTGTLVGTRPTYLFPRNQGVRRYLAQLVAFRELLLVMVARDLKARYTHSLLGFYWAIINPLAHAAVYTVAFSLIVRVDVGSTPYPLFVLSGLLCWNLLAHSVIDATESLVEHGNLLSRVPFPREIIPLSAILARIPDFMLSLVVLIVIMAVFGWPLHPHIFVSLLLVGLQVLFITGIGLCASALNLFYRDVRQLVAMALPLWMFMSPLVYPSTLVPERFQGLYHLNPMVSVINAYRTVLLHGTLPTWADVAPPAIAGLVLLVGGFWLFKKLEPQFAEVA